MLQPSPTKTLTVIGMDPSLRNWGLAAGVYDLTDRSLKIYRLDVIQPLLTTGKQVRQNSKDLETAVQLARDAAAAVEGAHAVFVEVPVGSQSARAMASYGVCVGVLGAMRARGIPFFEVNPSEVKVATGMKKDASKKAMIEWAIAKHPEAPWPTYSRHGKAEVSEAKAEHMADAIAAIYAGIACSPFQQLLRMAA
jgi:Holliday junction resolvasome RuvABC endonuclease subunit